MSTRNSPKSASAASLNMTQGSAAGSSAAPASPGARSYGADQYSVDFVKKQSLKARSSATDPQTTCFGTISSCDARCIVSCGQLTWVAEREGSITVRKQDGEISHIIERRKGAYVFCMVEVGHTVWAGCSDGFIRILSQTTYKMERQFSRHGGGGGSVNTLTYHAPSQSVFSGSNDFEILAWDASTGEFLRQFSGHGNAIRALLADTHTLYSGSDDGTIIVWDLVSGQKVQQWTGHSKGVHSLAMTENHIWSGSEDATVRIWAPSTGECIGVGEVHTGSVDVLTVVGDKVWSGAGDTVCVWNGVNLQLMGTYVVHDGYVNNIVIASKTTSYKVWSSASDTTVKVWETESSPDETAVLKRKIERLSTVDFDNARLQEALSQREAQLDDLTKKFASAQEEIAKLLPLREENQKLREDIVAREDTISRLQGQIRDAENKNAELSSQVSSLERLVGDLRNQNERIAEDLNAARQDIATLNNKLAETVESYENRLHDMNSALASLESERSALQTTLMGRDQENEQLRGELARATTEIESLSSKLREMDIIFKSRLTLITEIFKLYKRFEATDKKLRSASNGQQGLREVTNELSAVCAQFKYIISTHFTDDELNHLGSSRHFFPLMNDPMSSTRSLISSPSPKSRK